MHVLLHQPWAVLRIVAMCCIALLSACTTTFGPARSGRWVRQDRLAPVEQLRVGFRTFDPDKTDPVAGLGVVVTGGLEHVWLVRDVYEGEHERTVRSYDEVTFGRLSPKAVRFPATRAFWSEHPPFELTEAIGFFPLTAKLLNQRDHPFAGFSKGTRYSNVVSPVLPCTLSETWFAAIGHTIAMPVSLLPGDPEPQESFFLAPFVVVLCPAFDAVMHSLDLAAMAVGVGYDLAKDTVVFAVDTTMLAGSVAADTVMTAGDVVFPTRLTKTWLPTGHPMWGEWSLTGAPARVDFTALRVEAESGSGAAWAALNEGGRALLPYAAWSGDAGAATGAVLRLRDAEHRVLAERVVERPARLASATAGPRVVLRPDLPALARWPEGALELRVGVDGAAPARLAVEVDGREVCRAEREGIRHLTCRVDIARGETTRLRAVAVDTNGAAIEREVLIEGLNDVRRARAVLVGIAATEDGLRRAPFADKDAADFARQLEQGGWAAEQVVVLRNAEATRGAVNDALQAAAGAAGEGGTLLVGWFGPGYDEPLRDPDRVLPCYDFDAATGAGGWTPSAWRETLGRLPVRDVVLLADAGEANSALAAASEGAPQMRIAKPAGAKARLTMIAGPARARGPLPEGRINGFFAAVALRGLAGAADEAAADGRGDGVITLGELRRFLVAGLPGDAGDVAALPTAQTEREDDRVWALRLTGDAAPARRVSRSDEL